MDRPIPKIKIVANQVRPGQPDDDYPEVVVYGVEVITRDAAWLESFAAAGEVHAFLRGLQAGSQMSSGPHFPVPDVPVSR